MTNVQGFCHVWSAVIDDDLFRLFGFLHGKILVCLHFIKIRSQKLRVQLQINKARIHNLDI